MIEGGSVPTSAVLFALLAGASAATWTLCLKLGSTKINVALGALVVTSAAFVANAVTLIVMRARGHEIVFQWEALWLLAIAGLPPPGSICARCWPTSAGYASPPR